MSTIQGSNSKQVFNNAEKYEAKLAETAKKMAEPDAYQDKKGVIEKDTLSRIAPLEKKSSDELAKLYETYNTDGADGLTETEFDSLFNSVMATSETTATSDTQATVEKNGETKTITVKAGDTLSKIARENGVSLADLKEANPHLFKDGKDSGGKTRSAGGNLIYPGDQVKIPQKPAETGATEKKDEAKTETPKDSEKAKETEKPKETEKSKESEKTKETDKTKETEKADESAAEKTVAEAKKTIDNAKLEEITPESLETMTPADLTALQEKDTKTVEGAKAALEQIPADDPQRAEYEGKVSELETEFKTEYGITDEIKVDEGIDDNEARRMVSSRSPEELDKLDLGTRIGMIKAMDRGATSVAEDQAIGKVALSIARTNPEALSSEVVAHMDDNGVREFIKGATSEDLDKLTADTRGAMIQQLVDGHTSNEEDKMIGQLAASLAKTHPEALTGEVIRAIDDNGVRALMDHLDADGLAKLPAGTRTAMIQQLVEGHTSAEEDALIGRLGASLAATDPGALTPELVRGMDDNGVREMTKDMSVADLSKLPRAVLEAMRQELRAGWTTEMEYQQIDKITQALPNAK